MKTLRTIAVMMTTALWAAAAVGGSLTGTVKNSVTLVPIAGAFVTVNVLIPDSIPFPTVTAADGSYEITGIIPDNEIYVVIAAKVGYRQSYTRVADLGSQDLVFNILLEPDTVSAPPPGGGGDSGNVAGTIYEVAGGGGLQGLSGATVTLYAGGGTTIAVSGIDGAYEARIPSGSYALTVSGVDFESLALSGLSLDSNGATVNAVVKKTLTEVEEDPDLPGAFALEQNYPNPFNPSTHIRFLLPSAAEVEFVVYNVLGVEVARLAEGTWPAGPHEVVFEAGGLPGGVYYYRLIAGTFTGVGKMLLIR